MRKTILNTLVTSVALLTLIQHAHAADTVLSVDIKEADGTSGQNANTGAGIKTSHLQNNAVTGSKLATSAVTTTKIAPGAITENKLAPALAGEIFNTKLNIYDSNNTLVGPVFDKKSASSASIILSINDSPVIAAVSSTRFFTDPDWFFVEAYYESSNCSGVMYGLDSNPGIDPLLRTKSLFRYALVFPNPETGNISAYLLKAAPYVSKTIASKKFYDGTTKSYKCEAFPSPAKGDVLPLVLAKDLSVFVPPFHADF